VWGRRSPGEEIYRDSGPGAGNARSANTMPIPSLCNSAAENSLAARRFWLGLFVVLKQDRGGRA
jgi:hypothetical protein